MDSHQGIFDDVKKLINIRGIENTPDLKIMDDGAALIAHNCRVHNGELRMRAGEKLLPVYDLANGAPTKSTLHSSNISTMYTFAPDSENRFIIYGYDNTVEVLANDRVHILTIDAEGVVQSISGLGNIIAISTDKGLRYIYYKEREFKWLGAIEDVDNAITINYEKESKLDITEDMQDPKVETYGTCNIWTTTDVRQMGSVQTTIEAAVANVIGGADKRHGDARLLYGARLLCYAYRLFDGTYIKPSAYIITDDITEAKYTGSTYGYIEEQHDDKAPTYTFSDKIFYDDAINVEGVSFEGEYYKDSSVFQGVRDFLNRKYVGNTTSTDSISRGDFFKKGSAFSVCIGKAKDTNNVSKRSFVSVNLYNLRISITMPTSLEKWKDVIQGIDFFISDDLFGKSDYRLFSEVAEEVLSPNVIVANEDDLEKNDTFRIKKGNSVVLLYKLQRYNKDEIEKNIQNLTGVNRLCSIDFEPGKTGYFSLLGDDDEKNESITDDEKKWKSYQYIDRASLVLQQQLPSSLSSETKTGRMHMYNSRLHLYNYADIYTNTPTSVKVNDIIAKITIDTPDGERDIYTKVNSQFAQEKYIFFRGLNTRKVSLWTVKNVDGLQLVGGDELKMTPCNSANLSYAKFSENAPILRKTLLPTWDAIIKVNVYSEIAVSDALNAFSFPATNNVVVGRSRIRSLATVALPIVQGAYKEYPLFIASEDCIYAAEVGSDGLYTSVRPISRDVPTSEMLGIEDGVVYLSDRGLTLMTGGGNGSSVSGVIMGDEQLNNLSIQEQKGVFSSGIQYALRDYSFENVAHLSSTILAYDHKESKIYVSSPLRKGSYVFSLGDKSWSTSDIYYEHFHVALPYSYGIRGNELYSLAEEEMGEENALWLSAPIKLGTDELKYIRRVKLHCSLSGVTEARFFLWMSNDNKTYRAARALRSRQKEISGVDFGCLVRLACRYVIIGVALINPSHNCRISAIEIEVDKQYGNNRQMQ